MLCRHLDVSLLVRVPPDELLRNRRRMVLALSRHGRIQPTYWEGKEVNEMRAFYNELVEAISRERGDPEELDG